MVTMVENGDVTDPENKKIHPFFTAPKNSSKDSLFNNVTLVTPDPSCSPKSVDNTDSTPLSGKLKRKRNYQQTDDARDVSFLDSSSKQPKVLKLNLATGTIGSPPKSQPSITKKNTKRSRKPKSFLASMRYGQGDDTSRVRIAQKINKILANSQETRLNIARDALPNTPPSSRDTNEQSGNGLGVQEESTQRMGATKCIPGEKTFQLAASQADTTPDKPTHPFFQGKPKPSTVTEEKEKSKLATTSSVKRQVFFSSTPSSSKHLRPVPPNFNFPAPGTSYSNNVKVPGAQHPAWPSKETAHVRGGIPRPYGTCGDVSSRYLLKKRKAKGQQVRISESESVLSQVVSSLNLKQLTEELKACDNDEFHPPPAVLRIPGRHFESGKNLQGRVFDELKTLHRCGDDPKTHPAIAHAYSSIEKGLSAFDKSTCETSSWAQKYAPSLAERVLQSGREAELLRDWLENLKVLAVDTGTIDSGTKPKAIAPTKGKGKRKKKTDDFIVFSDDEADELGEISDEGDCSGIGSHSNAKKTIMRSGSHRDSRDGGRFVNAVVLSGPHGCGKTATVYAIAKELDFEVFEINAGARRNGKDVLEKVGDMTRNHLVQRHHKSDSQREGIVHEDEVDQDLKSRKQGTMAAFFKRNPTPVQKPAKSTDSSGVKEVKKPSKTQKQSLILLEEVDVLYEEDKQFWSTVISMILQSKRPFVMTCNDEALVPLQSLNLHGIFRFSSPAKDLAVDLLLLIAANEGHALRRHAVETLYDSRGHDLRASITELNYWCQIGVGDVQGGFNWFYPRWPKGSDVDEGGDTIRVISQDSYQAGMGWLNRDAAASNSLLRSAQEELHQQALRDWSFDAYESNSYDDFVSRATIAIERGSSAKERLEFFKSIESFTGFMSDADIGSPDSSDVPNQVAMDASIPHIPTKTREDFIVGRQLLEAFPLVRYDTVDLDVSTALKDLSKNKLRDAQTFDGTRNVYRPLGETQVTAQLEVYLSDLLRTEPAVIRLDYGLAFDPIAASEKNMAAGYLEPSVFDGTMNTISLDIAPYVRSIVAYDQRLQQERSSRSSLLSEGGQPGRKRMRTTRSAYSAIEGGTRASIRRERYFTADINPHLVMRTGGRGWDAIASVAARRQDAADRSVQDSGELENDDDPD